MIKGLGIDIVKIDRIKSYEDFAKKILTEKEFEIFAQKIGKKKLEYLAGRFAGKEAIIKALSDYEAPTYQDLEILNKENGKPYIKFKNYNILISISNEHDLAVAEAILIDD